MRNLVNQLLDGSQFIDSQMKQSLLTIILTILALFSGTLGVTDSTSFPLPYSDPSFACSSFCKYLTDGTGKLVAMCNSNNAGPNGNGQCKDCDELLFRKIPNGAFFTCTAHNYNGEYLQASQDLTGMNYKVGYYDNTQAIWKNIQTWSSSAITQGNVATLPPHFAVRIRFGISLYKYLQSIYTYPLSYSLDETVYTYNQTLYDYWSSFDIITSPTQPHTISTLMVTFRSLDKLFPINNDSCPYNTCECRCSYFSGICVAGNLITVCQSGSAICGCASCSCSVADTCCDQRYIQIRDILLFSSRCLTGCLSCSSQTYCMICDYPNLYYLNPADHLCYLTCPQATYPNSTGIYFVNNPATLFEFWCLPCNATCLECSSPTVCYRCYTLGRNESFLYNNTCVNPCPLNYARNYTNHTCDCSYNNFYEILATLTCLPCALECLHCTGPTNRECSACMPDYFLSYGTTFCLNDCPAGQFKDMATNRCSNCDTSCGSCDLVSTRCTECYFTSGGTVIMYLLGAECLSWCPPGYAWNNVTHVCDMCALYTFSYFGKCVKYCPTLYQWNEANRSCLHLSLTDFTFNLSIASIDIVPHGKLIKFTILVQDGLSNQSLAWILKKSYFWVQIVYTDAGIQYNNTVRTLQTVTLVIRNVVYSNNQILYYTNIPAQFDYKKSFQIIFPVTLSSLQGIDYGNSTNVVVVSSMPQLMKQYFTYSSKNYYNVIMIPMLVIVIFIIVLQIKGVYELLMELLRIVQVLGLLVYSSFPVGQFIYAFLVGCSYSNLDFIVNIYNIFASPQHQTIFTSYYLTTDGMTFIRLNGSIIFFALLWTVTYFICKYLFFFKQSRLQFVLNFGFDIMQVKILHSFWSSAICVILNYDKNDFSIFITFAFAVIFLITVLIRRGLIWKQKNDISPSFIWRLSSTLVVCFVAMANQIVITILLLLAFCISIWHFSLLHSNKYLVNINNLNSNNYMDEDTYRILNNYDEEVKYSMSISIRNAILVLMPIVAATLMGVLILLKEAENTAVYFDTIICYTLLLVILVIIVFVYKFLEERRKYLVQNKLQFLQKKYSKLNVDSPRNHSQRKRPRLTNTRNVIDDQKALDISKNIFTQ